MEIRRSYDRLISTMGFPILVRRHLYIESGPRLLFDRPPYCLNELILTHLPLVPHICIGDLGPVSLTVFPSQFKFDGNLDSLSPLF